MKPGSGFVQIKGVQIYYEISGNGEDIVFLHGNPLDLRVWDNQSEFFAEHYSVLRFDFRGYGKSGNPGPEGYSHAETLVRKIEKHLLKSLDYEVIVVVRTKEQIEEIINQYPFANVIDHDKCRIHVALLSAVPKKNDIKELISLNNDNEMFSSKKDNLYILLRGGLADSLTGKNIVEKKLKVRATVRNWNTVNKVLAI